MTDAMQYVWPLTVLIIFGGMLALCWRALSIAHDLAKIVLQAGLQAQVPSIVPAHKLPVPSKPATAPTQEVPDEAIDQGLVNYIKKAEGFRPNAYWDYKQWSIGFGTKTNSPTEVIDQAEGERRLRIEVVNADNL